jgi:5-methylthioadenosine/S-adenosylhomocysteine deaminase
MLGPDMLLVHAIETDAADIRRLRDTATFVVHCPKSNATLGHRVAPVAAMRSNGVHVSLGTDSLASNDDIDMFAEMRLAVVQQDLPCEEVFRMATIEGAKALGLEEGLGSLDPGKYADFAVVRLKDPSSNPIEDMVVNARLDSVIATFIGGREVPVEDREIQRVRERMKQGFG